MKIRLSVIIKNIIRRIFCKHEYKWDCSVIASHKNCEEPYDLVYLDLVCKKCGKTKSIKYTKPLDSNVGQGYNKRKKGVEKNDDVFIRSYNYLVGVRCYSQLL